MRLFLIGTAAVLAISAGVAFAGDGNAVNTEVKGTGNNATVTQNEGNNNIARVEVTDTVEASLVTVTQQDDGNEANVLQSGDTARVMATVSQNGDQGLAAIEQTDAFFSTAEITQDNVANPGDNANIAGIKQTGGLSSSFASIVQFSEGGVENEASISQDGVQRGNAVILQSGNGNRSAFAQTGSDSDLFLGRLTQEGNLNSAQIDQVGDILAVIAEQEGAGNILEVAQSGEGQDARTMQLGDDNEVYIEQSGFRNFGVPEADGITLLQFGAQNIASIAQHADVSTLVLRQEGDENSVNLAQGGFNNSLVVRQNGEGNEAEVVQEGAHNSLTLTQTGAGNGYSGNLAGLDNIVVVNQ